MFVGHFYVGFKSPLFAKHFRRFSYGALTGRVYIQSLLHRLCCAWIITERLRTTHNLTEAEDKHHITIQGHINIPTISHLQIFIVREIIITK